MRQRSVQRLRLESPLPGRLGRDPARILNISLRGALVETRGRRKTGEAIRLVIDGDEPITLDGRVTRCEVARFERDLTWYHVGIAYPLADLEAQARLRQLLVDLLMSAIEGWKRNATVAEADVSALSIFDPRSGDLTAAADDTRITRIWHRLVGGAWQTSTVASGVQPIDGFCVTSDVEPDEIALLRDSYERSDEQGRQWIRLLATLAIREKM